MAVQVSFWAGEDEHINNLSGSGLGFYGSNFGASVKVGSYQNTTFITNAAGTALGPQVNNVTWLNAASGIVDSATSGIALTAIPNKHATLNIRVTSDSAITLQNPELRITSRDGINLDPSGVLCKVAELVHPNTVQDNSGSGSTTWQTPTGSSVVMSFNFESPATSGLAPQGNASADTRHDFHIAMSASPSQIGSKLFQLYFSVEYL